MSEVEYCIHGVLADSECYRCLEQNHHNLRLKKVELEKENQVLKKQLEKAEDIFKLHCSDNAVSMGAYRAALRELDQIRKEMNE